MITKTEQLTYEDFLNRKSQIGGNSGFEPTWIPDFLFDFQKHLIQWNCNKGRSATLADCGLGKGPMALTWAENVYRETGKPVLIAAPLAVSHQFEREGSKFNIPCVRSQDGSIPHHITATNYERLHHFKPEDFGGFVGDESSILKSYSGATRNAIIEFVKPVKYRLLATATPSPNDHTELGNSVEALGIMRRVEMLANFFVHDGGDTGTWRLKGHGEKPFWKFVASWARAVRKPSDIGFSDDKFILPALNTIQHTLKSEPMDGFLFPVIAATLDEQRHERRETLRERCEKVAEIANARDDYFVAWCSLNSESELLNKLLDDSVEITGSQSDDEKSELLDAFADGKIKRIVTKPDICGHGVNWQHCNAMSFFPSHSHEQYYQLVRRCWRFGQAREVDVHIVTTESESAVLENLRRKERMADEMFSGIVAGMKSFYTRTSEQYKPTQPTKLPSWI